jgi:hypothetical protein
MPSPFETYTKDEANAGLQRIDADQQATLDFLAGDHWQKGKQYVGPPDADMVGRDVVLTTKIYPIFVSKNIIKEIIESHRDAVIGQEPDWSAATRQALPKGQDPSAQLQALMDEAEMLATEWWDSKRTLDVLQDATANLLATGRGPLRLFVPKAFIREDGTPEPGDLKTWLGRIYLMAPSIGQQAIITDYDSMMQAGVYVTENKGEKRTELSFVDDDGKTILRVYDDKGNESETDGLELGGNIHHFEMQRAPLITEQIRQNQALFNTTLTMRTRNVGVGGFPERTFLNAKAPSHFEADPDDANKQIEVFDDFKVGPGVTNFVAGHSIEDENGNIKGLSSATVTYRDPVKVDSFEATERAAYQNILEEARQLHRLIARDATASGESRIQARSDFITSLRDTKTQVDAAGRWILETALALAATLSNNAGKFNALRFRFDSQIDAGPISADERRLIREETEGAKPLRSVQNAMTLLGVEDPQAMIEEIASESELFGATPETDPPGNPDPMPTDSGQPPQESTAVQ